jgi:hypothetical protein
LNDSYLGFTGGGAGIVRVGIVAAGAVVAAGVVALDGSTAVAEGAVAPAGKFSFGTVYIVGE